MIVVAAVQRSRCLGDAAGQALLRTGGKAILDRTLHPRALLGASPLELLAGAVCFAGRKGSSCNLTQPGRADRRDPSTRAEMGGTVQNPGCLGASHTCWGKE